jgi:hypothetical protein
MELREICSVSVTRGEASHPAAYSGDRTLIAKRRESLPQGSPGVFAFSPRNSRYFSTSSDTVTAAVVGESFSPKPRQALPGTSRPNSPGENSQTLAREIATELTTQERSRQRNPDSRLTSPFLHTFFGALSRRCELTLAELTRSGPEATTPPSWGFAEK